MKNKLNFFKHLSKNYTKFPNKVFHLNNKMPLGLISFYLFVLSLPEEFNPAISYISSILGVSKNTTMKYLKELENRGMIKKYVSGRASKSIDKYEFTKPSDWIID